MSEKNLWSRRKPTKKRIPETIDMRYLIYILLTYIFNIYGTVLSIPNKKRNKKYSLNAI